MLVIAFYNDFLREYYIAVMMALAMFLMILFNQSYLPVIISALIILPALALLIRFLIKYSYPEREETNG